MKLNNFELLNVPGLENTADLMTKNLGEAQLQKHVEALGMRRGKDRAATAPTLATVRAQQHEENPDDDKWEHTENEVIRIHVQPRVELFTPRRIPEAPPSKNLAAIRVTEGKFVETGQHFKVVDAWTKRSTAHRELSGPWTGSTKFIKRMDDTEHDEK